MLADIAKSGYVTMRVEKPGVGDSEGGPFADLDYNTEIDIYRQALKQLKAQPEVDNDNVFICGHSMGGAVGVIGVYLAFGVIALAVDRRALLVSALASPTCTS